jgi:hypothetical protein
LTTSDTGWRGSPVAGAPGAADAGGPAGSGGAPGMGGAAVGKNSAVGSRALCAIRSSPVTATWLGGLAAQARATASARAGGTGSPSRSSTLIRAGRVATRFAAGPDCSSSTSGSR